MNTTIFCGCSYVAGDGLDGESASKDLWVNIVHGSVPGLQTTRLINLGQSGSSNRDIMLTAMAALLANPGCKNLFVSWTNTKRMHVNPGVELYSTRVYLENSDVADVKINPNTVIPGSYIQNIRDRFFMLNHPHHDLVEILIYTAMIHVMARAQHTKCYFVNSLLDIDRNYFDHINSADRKPSHTTALTQRLLQLDTRDDFEYFALYDQIHQEYQSTLGLEATWLNLDQGYRKYFYIDQGNDNLHPGPKSNLKFANFIIEKISQIQKQP